MNLFAGRDTDYFELFSIGVRYSLESARQLKLSLADGTINAAELSKIKEIEHEADKHVHVCFELIEKAFITPIDRTDIFEIVRDIDSITDSVNAIANHIYMLRIEVADPVAVRLVDLCVQSCEKLCELMPLVKNSKRNLKRINELVIDVNHIEEEGDKLFMTAMRELFEPGVEPLRAIKGMEIYNRLEDALDRCEDVADLVEKVVIAKI